MQSHIRSRLALWAILAIVIVALAAAGGASLASGDSSRAPARGPSTSSSGRISRSSIARPPGRATATSSCFGATC